MPDTLGNPQVGDPNYVAPPSGLVDAPTAPTAPNAPAVTANVTPAQYTPGAYTPPAGADIATNVKNIVAEDSPLMQQAAERARQAMNAKGLLNTSIAAGAEQEAVIGAALPLAQQKSTQEFQAGATTFQAGEQAKQFSATSINTALQAGATAENTNRLQAALATLDSQTKTSLATLDAQNRQLLQTNVNAANAYNQTIQNIAAIQQNVNMDSGAKATAVQSQLNLLNEFLRTTQTISTTLQADVTSLNLTGLFGGGTGGLQYGGTV